MVDESLKQYLLTKTKINEDNLSKLLSYDDFKIELTDDNKRAICDALFDLKVIDPACGSGAFPMGVLQKMLLILQKIDSDNKIWLAKMLSEISDPVFRRDAKQKLSRENWDYIRKLGIIQKSIYGVDIQSIAVEISKLRFFLSLVVDSNIDEKEDNWGIDPLPNLEFKFVAANSLMGLPNKQQPDLEDQENINKLKLLREEYFRSSGEKKQVLEKEFDDIQIEMFKQSIGWEKKDRKSSNRQSSRLAEWRPFSDKSSSWFDSEWMFGVYDGFDIVIANPPYIVLSPQKFKGLELVDGNYNTYVAFIEKLKSFLNDTGIASYIIPTTWMAGNNFQKLREFLLNNKSIYQIIQLPYDMFEVYVDNVIIFLIGKGKAIDDILTYKFDTKDNVKSDVTFTNFSISIWQNEKEKRVFLNKELISILDKYYGIKSKKLDSIAKVQRGTLPPKANEKYDVHYKNRDMLLIPWFNHQIHRYYIEKNKVFNVDYNKLKENKPMELFECNKILGRQLISRQFRLKFAYYDLKGAFKKNLYAIYSLQDDYNYYSLLAILNSKLYSYIQVNVNTSGQRDDYPAFSLEDYRNFLIPDISIGLQNQLINIVQDIMNITYKNSFQQSNHHILKIDHLDKQIDDIIYNIYNLTQKEIAIVEGNP